MNALIIKIMWIVTAFLAAAGAKYIFHLPPNNPIQVEAEKIIEDETGLEKSELLTDLL